MSLRRIIPLGLFLLSQCCHISKAFAPRLPAFHHQQLLQQQYRTSKIGGGAGGIAATATTAAQTVEPALPNFVFVLKDAKAVGKEIRKIVKQCAEQAIEERGYFALAIPGGSILKMLVSDSDDDDDDFLAGDWTSKTFVAYVNHKCVPMDDIKLATHAKARQLFLDNWKGVTTLTLDGSDNAQEEAAKYEANLKALSTDILPREIPSGVPVFDLSLIGVGDDGHVGSLYPGRDEVLVGSNGPWVLPVDMKSPPSITLSLPLMAAARTVVVAACGVSEKYPQGKSEGMRRAIADPNETLQTFPAVGLREAAKWIIDEAAASKLGDEYKTK